jgi:hypothetical protein
MRLGHFEEITEGVGETGTTFQDANMASDHDPMAHISFTEHDRPPLGGDTRLLASRLIAMSLAEEKIGDLHHRRTVR